MKTIPVACATCKVEFEKKATEVRRAEKLGRRHYCSRRCCGLDNVFTPEETRKGNQAGKGLGGRRADELSPFRWHLRRIKTRSKQRGKPDHVGVTLEDLKSQWEKQKGICPYTGWALKQMDVQTTEKQLELTPDRASVDRIDSSKGYTPDNIEFVAYQAQMAKHAFSPEDLYHFCEVVVSKVRRTSCERTHIDQITEP